MHYLLLPFRILFKIYYLIFFSLSLLILFPIFYYLLSDPKRFPKAFAVMRFHAFLLLLFAGARLKIKGAENIPKNGAYIICPNHTSFLDTFCIYRIFTQYFVFIGKQEIENWPLFHIFYTSGMNILIDRHSRTGSIKALKRMSKELENGNPLVIFPEGTISNDAPRLGPFKPGAFAMAIQKQIPILPVSFTTNWKRLQKGGLWKGLSGPGISEVIIHQPVKTKGLQKEDIAQLQNQITNIISAPIIFKYKKSFS